MAAFSSATSGRQGQVINWLTIVAAVFLPLTFVTGYLGMNLSTITGLHGTPTFIVLAIVLPLVITVCTALLLRFLDRPRGSPTHPARASLRPQSPDRPTSSLADARVGGSLSRRPGTGG